MHNLHYRNRSFASIFCVGTVAAALVALVGTGSCHDRGDDFLPIELDTCPGSCTGCNDDFEKYTCHLWTYNQFGEQIGVWLGETCAPPNRHPSEVSIAYSVGCVAVCNLEVEPLNRTCSWQFGSVENEEGQNVLEIRVFQDGPLCDSSLPPGGGGAGSGGAFCEGDSGTGAYDEEPPESSCPPWYTPGPLIASTPSTGVMDVNIDKDFVQNLRDDTKAPLTCDTGRYIEGEFEAVQPGELFYELGFRNGDADAQVRGFDPATQKGNTPWFGLEKGEELSAAFVALFGATGLNFKLKRGIKIYQIWVNVIDCGTGACPAP